MRGGSSDSPVLEELQVPFGQRVGREGIAGLGVYECLPRDF